MMTTRLLCLRCLPRGAGRSAPKPSAAMLDAALRDRLAADVEEFSPLVGWVDGVSLPCLFLDISRTAAWFGGETALLQRLRHWAAERTLACRATVAATLGVAWGVAHFGQPEESGPWACRRVPAEETMAALLPLPVEALRPPPATLSLLRELGIRHVAQLLTLPRDALAERFGPELLLRIDQALGRAAEVFTPHHPPPRCEAALTWDHGVTTIEPIVAACERLLPQLTAPLQRRGHAVVRFLAEFTGSSGGLARLVVGLLRPTLDARYLLDLLQLRLESVRLREPVTGVRLALLDEAPLDQQQQVLFADLAPPVESYAWSTLVERLSGRLGPGAVLQVRLRADHQPELAWKGVPWIDHRAKPRRRVAKADTASPPLSRPTLLLSEPRPIQVWAIAPQGHPRQFRDENREYRVTHSWGPERIETGWWRGPSVRRDYYRVQTDMGPRCWLFRDLRRGRWYLHGWFD